MTAPTEHLDVIVVGAGLSGIGAGYRLQEALPGLTYAILEAREDLGGTWDLFRYPGVRSDSDMYTLGYAFKPWRGGRSIAAGADILAYLHDLAAETGVRTRMRFGRRVVAADFDTGAGRWTLTVEEVRSGARTTLTCDFLYCCAGYYDYERPQVPEFAGEFAGPIVHPQFWPAGLAYAGKRVVVVGSGATAATLVPALLTGEGAAAHVTMLQRTPTWMASLPSIDRRAVLAERVLPPAIAHRAIRGINIALGIGLYQFCQRAPRAARRVLTRRAARQLGDAELAREFTAPYKPWDQRLCALPDGDLFRAVRSGAATVVTDEIDRLVADGVRLCSGRVLAADVIVTATGLRLLAFGGMTLSVDGSAMRFAEQFVWHGAMVTGLPNFATCIGYTNASWTLRADLTHRLVCRVLRRMRATGRRVMVPRPAGPLSPQPLLGLTAGYVRRSIDQFPRQGRRVPWRTPQNYLLDRLVTLHPGVGRGLAHQPGPGPELARGRLLGVGINTSRNSE